jgi:O-antigen ligase
MNKTILRNLYLGSLIAVAATLPFTIQTNSIAIFFCTFIWVICSRVEDKILNFNTNKTLLILYLLYFGLNIIGLLWTNNFDDSSWVIEKNLSIAILPLILLTGPVLSVNELRKIFFAFIIACLSGAFISLVLAIYRYTASNDIQEFFYYNLTQTFGMHPIYLSLYYALCICLLYFRSEKFNKKQKIGVALLILFFALNIFLLDSKMVIGASMVLFSLFIFRLLCMKLGSFIWPTLAFVVILVISSIALFNFSPRFKEIASLKSLSILKEDRMTDFMMVNGLTLRLMFWKFSLKDFPPTDMAIGLGTGDVQDFLDRTYEMHNMAISYDGKVLGYYGYDAHNQFLDIFLRFGFLGLGIFLLLLFSILKRFISIGSNLYISFFFMVICIFFSETFLGLNKGIVFFALFTSLFWLENEKICNENRNSWY